MFLSAFLDLGRCTTFNRIPIILNLLTNRNIALIYSVTEFVNKEQRIVLGQTASNINYSTVVLNFDICRASSTMTRRREKSIFASSHIFHGWFSPFSSAADEFRCSFIVRMKSNKDTRYKQTNCRPDYILDRIDSWCRF